MTSDLLDILIFLFKIYCYISISLLPFVLYYSLFESKYKPNSKFYPRKAWYYFLKVLWAIPAVEKYKTKFENIVKNSSSDIIEKPRQITSFTKSNSQTIFGNDQKGNSLFLKINLRENRWAEVCLQIRFQDGSSCQLPNHPLVLLCSIPQRQWKAGGLTIEVIKPFETLLITYNGLLRDQIRNDESVDEGTVKHVYFSFIWSAASSVKYFPQNSNTVFLARAVAVEPWKDANWINLLGYQAGFSQYGMLTGEIKLPNSQVTWRLSASRLMSWGPSDAHVLHRGLVLFGYTPHGFGFTINVKSYTLGCKELHIGDVILPNKSVYVIEDCNISLPDFFEDRIIPGAFEFAFKADGTIFDCRAFTCLKSIADIRNEEERGYKMKLIKIKYTVNGENATGLGLFWYKYKGRGMEKPGLIVRPGKQIVIPEKILVAPLKSTECKSEYLAGTKGTQLSLLASISKPKFKTAEGFCILTPALAQYLEVNRNIKMEIQKLKDICSGKEEGDISEICDNIQDLFKIEPITQFLKELIFQELRLIEMKNDSEEKQFWTVRSSYISADFNMYPNLKNKTVLDCSNFQEVLQSIKLCWASTYDLKNVEYRKKNCLPIEMEVAVVVQRLVNSEKSGTIFTNEPQRNNSGKIVILSNFGVRMTSMANISEPDKIILNRTWDDNFSIISKEVGTKLFKIVLTEKGITKEEVDDDETEKLSIDNNLILELSQIGVTLEKTFGGPKIIQWALENSNIYILNVKSMKEPEKWSEYTLLHEADTALLSEKTHLNFEQRKYFFEQPLTNLDQSIIFECINKSLRDIYGENNQEKLMHRMTNFVGQILPQVTTKDEEISLITKINQFVKYENNYDIEKTPTTFPSRNIITTFLNQCSALKSILYCSINASEFAKESLILAHAMKVIFDENELIYFRTIQRNFCILQKVFFYHECVVRCNEYYQKVLLYLLYDENDDISRKDYKNIISRYCRTSLSKIPIKLEKIANLIKLTKLDQEFLNIDGNDALIWMELNCMEGFQIFGEILVDVGHYSLKEMKLKTDIWNNNKDLLIKIIQMIIKSGKKITEDSKTDFVNENHEKTKENGKLFKWLESKLLKSFENLDITKQANIIALNKIRQAVQRLGENLVAKGILPSSRLIYYMSWMEIKQILKNKNSNVIFKSTKRSRFYKNWKQSTIKELTEKNDIILTSTKIVPMSLNKRVVQGKVRIVYNFKDLSKLESGDILVVKNLESGFIPVFPVVSGIIAENGSCLSQAATVAKQLHIPTIIFMENAMKIFQNGQKVQINGQLETVVQI